MGEKEGSEEAFKVFVRVRPLTEKEEYGYPTKRKKHILQTENEYVIYIRNIYFKRLDLCGRTIRDYERIGVHKR